MFATLMRAVQRLFHTAAFLTALVGTCNWLLILRIGRVIRVLRHAFLRIAVFCMPMSTILCQLIAIFVVFMSTEGTLRGLRITALGGMDRVVFAQAAFTYGSAVIFHTLGKNLLRQEGKYHHTTEQQTQNSFLRFHFSLSSLLRFLGQKTYRKGARHAHGKPVDTTPPLDTAKETALSCLSVCLYISSDTSLSIPLCKKIA